jgi:putative membrane protein
MRENNMYLFKKGLTEEKRQSRVKNRRVHMANERTFLAWIRTSIGIMAFGFVIEKFMVPVGNHNMASFHSPVKGSNFIAYLGIFLVFMGAASGLLATFRFLRTEKEIIEDTYHPSIIADILIAILLGSIGILLVIYLIFVEPGQL